MKTVKNDANVTEFLEGVEQEYKRKDSFKLLKVMKEITGEEPSMWGASIVGFGSYHYVYASGREGDWPLVGFSPRKQNLTLYIMPGFDRYEDLLAQLGKHRIGKSCLYIKKLEQIDMEILKEMIAHSVSYMRQKYHSAS